MKKLKLILVWLLIISPFFISVNRVSTAPAQSGTSNDSQIYKFNSNEYQTLDKVAMMVGVNNEWERGFTGNGVTVAILDSGVYPHPDLVKPTSRIIAFKDFVNGLEKPYDDSGHGTLIAGIIASNGFLSKGLYKGMAPSADLVIVKVLNEFGESSVETVIDGVNWVVSNREKYKIKILNISIGFDPSESYLKDQLAVAAEKARKSGIIVIAAVGNSGTKNSKVLSPAIDPRIIAVGAIDTNNASNVTRYTVADFSSRGLTVDGINKPDLMAPGKRIVSLESDTSYRPGTNSLKKVAYRDGTGTSEAAAVVSGIAAVLLQHHPEKSVEEIENMLLNSSIRINGKAVAQGKGMVYIK